MLIISDKYNAGVSGFYPVFFGSRKDISVVNWVKYRRLVWFFILIDVVFFAYFVLLMQESIENAEKAFLNASLLFFGYILLKVKLCQPKVKISINAELKKNLAPVSVWLEYIFLGMAGVMQQSVIMRVEPDQLFHYWAIALQVGFFAYAVTPFANYVKFRIG